VRSEEGGGGRTTYLNHGSYHILESDGFDLLLFRFGFPFSLRVAFSLSSLGRIESRCDLINKRQEFPGRQTASIEGLLDLLVDAFVARVCEP